jgi:hypothetical protein
MKNMLTLILAIVLGSGSVLEGAALDTSWRYDESHLPAITHELERAMAPSWSVTGPAQAPEVLVARIFGDKLIVANSGEIYAGSIEGGKRLAINGTAILTLAICYQATTVMGYLLSRATELGFASVAEAATQGLALIVKINDYRNLDKNMISLLLAKGGDGNVAYKNPQAFCDGMTLAHLAACGNNSEIICLLQEYGVDLRAADGGGCTPQDYCLDPVVKKLFGPCPSGLDKK